VMRPRRVARRPRPDRAGFLYGRILLSRIWLRARRLSSRSAGGDVLEPAEDLREL